MHYGNASDCAQHEWCCSKHARIFQRDGEVISCVSGINPAADCHTSSITVIFAGLRLGVSAGFIGAILAELKITPTGVGDIITYSRSIADYPSMYAAIFSIILLAVLFLNLIEKLETVLFKGNQRGYVSD